MFSVGLLGLAFGSSGVGLEISAVGVSFSGVSVTGICCCSDPAAVSVASSFLTVSFSAFGVRRRGWFFSAGRCHEQDSDQGG